MMCLLVLERSPWTWDRSPILTGSATPSFWLISALSVMSQKGQLSVGNWWRMISLISRRSSFSQIEGRVCLSPCLRWLLTNCSSDFHPGCIFRCHLRGCSSFSSSKVFWLPVPKWSNRTPYYRFCLRFRIVVTNNLTCETIFIFWRRLVLRIYFNDNVLCRFISSVDWPSDVECHYLDTL